MDIELNKIAKYEMSKARGNPNYNPAMDSVDHHRVLQTFTSASSSVVKKNKVQ